MGFSSSKGTTRSGTQFDVNAFNEFLKAIHGTLGGPFTVGDLFELSPRSQGLFTGEPMGPLRPGGGFNLGFGTPPSYQGPSPAEVGTTGGGATPGGGGATPTGDGTPPPTTTPPTTPPTTPSPGEPPAPTTPKQFTMSDILPAWNEDPEKRMDVPRLFRQAGLDPNGFSLEEFQDAVGRAKNFGFTGRSSGNFGRALSLLQNLTTNVGTFGGGKGTGIF